MLGFGGGGGVVSEVEEVLVCGWPGRCAKKRRASRPSPCALVSRSDPRALRDLDLGLARSQNVHAVVRVSTGAARAPSVRSCVKSGGVRRLCHDAVLRVLADMMQSAGFGDVQMEDRWCALGLYILY